MKKNIKILAWLSGTLLYMSLQGKILLFITSGERFTKCLKLCFTSVLFYCGCPLQDNSVNHKKNKKTLKTSIQLNLFCLKINLQDFVLMA